MIEIDYDFNTVTNTTGGFTVTFMPPNHVYVVPKWEDV